VSTSSIGVGPFQGEYHWLQSSFGRMPSLAVPRPSSCAGCRAEGVLVDDVLVGDQTQSAKGEEEPGPASGWWTPIFELTFFPLLSGIPLLLVDVGRNDNLHTDLQNVCRRDAAGRAPELGGRDDAIAKLATAGKIRPAGSIAPHGNMLRRNRSKENRVPRMVVKYHTNEISFYDRRSPN